MPFPENTTAGPRTLRHAAILSLLLCSALIGVLSCVDHRPPFTGWQEPEPGMLVDGGRLIDVGSQSKGQAEERSRGCIDCHKGVVEPHGQAVHLSCIDCHGGDGLSTDIETAHPRADHPEKWPKGGANPERPYTLTLHENWDWIRFVNPGDLRVARTTCAPCHPNHTLNVSKSVMTTVSHFWAVAGYANGIVSPKRSVFGESYSPEGRPQMVHQLVPKDEDAPRSADNWREATAAEIEKHSFVNGIIIPLPHFEITQTGNIFRVFEQGSRLGGPALGFNGLPLPLPGLPDKLEDPGRPNNRFSDRGLGTLNRVDLPILNVHKTRLNDPHLSMFGTNDQPGDYRSSGCTACHMVYANDRSPTHSGKYAKFGNMGHTSPANPDPTIPKGESGHPLEHKFTNSIPSSQCMVCHMHQPNSFVNSYYGFTMWTYDADGEHFFPEHQRDIDHGMSHEEFIAKIIRNPEEAAARGNWGDVDWLKDSAPTVNPKAKHTQFADYHGHGWMFRGAFKMDRKGNLLDKNGDIIPYDDPDKFKGVYPLEGVPGDHFTAASQHARRAVHLKDIHAEVGMHCVDCHFTYDVHNDGNMYAEYQAAIEVRCQDCHGTATEYAEFFPTGPAASAPGHFSLGPESFLDHLTPFGEPQFERDENGQMIQRSMMEEDKQWVVSQVKDSVTYGNPAYNERAAYYKTITKDNTWDPARTVSPADLAHQDSTMECYACHTSWVTACFGCHLPQRANVKAQSNHFEGQITRNLATYNPQVVRDAEFMLGVSPNVKNNTIAPVRSSSAVLISSEDAQRRRIYGQIPTMASNGMSSQIFNTHFPHTVRKTETRTCDDCHVSNQNNNNAWMAQVMLLGTNQVGFMGHVAWVGAGSDGIHGVAITEWEEPQCVIGSPMHAEVYPDNYQKFVDGGRILPKHEHHGGTDVRSVQLRGEYLYTASGAGGVEVFDVAQVFNKDFSEKIVTAPVSPLGQDTHLSTSFATAIALPTNQYTSMSRVYRPENHEQAYVYRGKTQNLHESYRYLYVTDRFEGLILVDVNCLTDGDPQNNFIERSLTFNPNGLLDGAENLAIAGTTVYVCCDRGIVAVDISDPLAPRVLAEIGAPYIVKPTSIAVQFRYAFVTDSEGVKVLDVTLPAQMSAVPGARIPLPDARDIYVAKTYGYVAAGAQGLVILDLERPEQPRVDQTWNADGQIDDLNQVKIAMTNDSVYAYLADGWNGLRVAVLVHPGDGPRSPYGWSQRPMPKLIAQRPLGGPALAVSKALDRDRAVDESGHQMTVFGRIGGRPMTLEEMRRLYLKNGKIYSVSNDPPAHARRPEERVASDSPQKR